MARRIKPAEASKTIADALGLSHFVIVNLIALIGEITPLLDFMPGKHPGMDIVKNYIAFPATSIARGWWYDDNTINLWLSMEIIIILASALYWVLCYFATRLIFALTQ